jgi:serine/threonine protein kinase
MSKILAKTSKHIIHMYDYDFHQNGLGFIVMELDQQDLAKALSSQPPLSPADRKEVGFHCHFLVNQVHLDIKPGNLVIFPRNVIKLGDMGSASRAHRTR